jgi:hypothetical protein
MRFLPRLRHARPASSRALVSTNCTSRFAVLGLWTARAIAALRSLQRQAMGNLMDDERYRELRFLIKDLAVRVEETHIDIRAIKRRLDDQQGAVARMSDAADQLMTAMDEMDAELEGSPTLKGH